jgi:hypothetical protein
LLSEGRGEIGIRLLFVVFFHLHDVAVADDDDDDNVGQKMFSPADMVNNAPGARLAIKSGVEKEEEDAAKKKKSKDIWDEDEVPREDQVEDPNDNRKRPRYPCSLPLMPLTQCVSCRYEILYKQSVSTEDVFLGLGDKSPSSEDCEAMVVKVHFPGCTLKDLELDVSRERFVAESETQCVTHSCFLLSLVDTLLPLSPL